MAELAVKTPAPPLTLEQAELAMLTMLEKGMVIQPVGSQFEPVVAQVAFEKLLANEQLRLADVNVGVAAQPDKALILAPGQKKPELVWLRFFMITAAGRERLKELRIAVASEPG